MWPNVVENILRQSVRPSLCVMVTHGQLPVPEVFIDAMEDNHIEFIADTQPMSVSPGMLTNHAFNRAARKDILMCTMDDDDYYGADYLVSMRDAMQSHSDAWLLGKSAYTTRYVDGHKQGQTVYDKGRVIDTQGHCKSLAGPTICIPSKLWNLYPVFRYPDMGMGCDSLFVQQAARLARQSPDPIYHVEQGEFYLQRYTAPNHLHAWNDPRDRQ